MKHIKHLCLAFALAIAAPVANAQVVYTCNSNVATSTCNYLNTTISGFYSSTFSNANASIYITYGNTGLGQSLQFFNFMGYTQYVAALTANTNQSPVQTSALSALNANDASPYGAGNVEVTSALGTALGQTGMTGIMSDGQTSCTLPGTGCYNAIITITNSSAITLYYDDQGGTEPDGAYDFYTTVQHETDEVLGTSSCISTDSSSDEPAIDGRTGLVKKVHRVARGVSAVVTREAKATLKDFCGAGVPSAVDLYRYSGSGALVLDSSLSTADGAFFSYDGGVTNGAHGVNGDGKKYNTKANDADYADFVSGGDDCATDEAVQNAFGCPGEDAGLEILNDGQGEINILNAVGYNLVVPAQPQSVNSNKTFIDFGKVVYPATGPKQDGLDLTNNGSTAATIGSISIVGTYGDAIQFSFASDCLNLNPGKKCHVTLSFTPNAVQISRATLKIPTTPGNTISVPLTGTGIVNASQ